MLQDQVLGAWQSSPLVVDGIMYLTQRPNDVLALDAKTGRVFWQYRYTNSADQRVCCGANNRGVAIHGDTLVHGHARRAPRGDRREERPAALEHRRSPTRSSAYSVTLAPLVIKDKVIVGVGRRRVRHPRLHRRLRRADRQGGVALQHDPRARASPGSETWSGDAWEHGGGSVWVTGSYDPELNLTYWGVGNPGPDWNPEQRPGDNLYTDSVVALDADTGALKWHFQFTPNDAYDYDAVQVPVLVDMRRGTARRAS